jgi:hypothetical protein
VPDQQKLARVVQEEGAIQRRQRRRWGSGAQHRVLLYVGADGAGGCAVVAGR